MKIIVADAVGFNGKPGIMKIKMKVVLEIPESAGIAQIWQEAKKAISKTPFVDPLINRYEVGPNGNETRVVNGSHALQKNDILYLTFC